MHLNAIDSPLQNLGDTPTQNSMIIISHFIQSSIIIIHVTAFEMHYVWYGPPQIHCVLAFVWSVPGSEKKSCGSLISVIWLYCMSRLTGSDLLWKCELKLTEQTYTVGVVVCVSKDYFSNRVNIYVLSVEISLC